MIFVSSGQVRQESAALSNAVSRGLKTIVLEQKAVGGLLGGRVYRHALRRDHRGGDRESPLQLD